MAASFSFSRIVSILLKLSLAAASFNVGYVFAIDFQLLWLISLFDFLSIMANAIPNIVAFAVISIFVARTYSLARFKYIIINYQRSFPNAVPSFRRALEAS